MPAIPTADLIARLRAAADPAAADRDLLRAFLASRSEPAFAALVRRYGPMVLGVCRRVLGDAHDADDAFQATFLVLARKAAAVGRPDRLPGWLHTIAVRTATEIRRMRDRRRKVELPRGGRQPPERSNPQGADAPRSPEQAELAAALDEELARLPEHYRTPVLLCELQGLSRKETAARLKLPEGTLSSRLAKARRLLADRLARRGVTATAAAITAALAREATARVPAALTTEAARVAVASAAGHAAAAASAAAVCAADGVVKALFVHKLKGLACALGVLAACAGGVATLPVGFGAAGELGGSAPRSDPDPAALVKQLGSPSFAEREAAEKKLRAMGPKARPALLAGMKAADPEVARRAAAIHDSIRREQLREELWKRFSKVVGDDRASRDLYATILKLPRNLDLLEAVEADPRRAGELYHARWVELQRLATGLPEQPPKGRPEPKRNRIEIQDLSVAEVAGWLYLGTYPGTARCWEDGEEGCWLLPERNYVLPKPPMDAIVHGPLARSLQTLFVRWLAARGDEGMLRVGLQYAFEYNIRDALDVARRLADRKDLHPRNRMFALLLLGKFGDKADLPRLRRFADDEIVIHTETLKDGSPWSIQIRDVAVAMMLSLTGRPHDRFWSADPVLANLYNPKWPNMPAMFCWSFGFRSAEDRDAAHKEARKVLADHLRPTPPPAGADKPDPEAEKLVKQLGSPAFADREAAEKRLKELGPKALPALASGAESADAEVARRAAAVRDHIYRDQLWARFAAAVGDDAASKELFTRIIADKPSLAALCAALDAPDKAADVYQRRYQEITNVRPVGPPAGPIRSVHPLEVVAGWLFLGTFRESRYDDLGRRLSCHMLPGAGSWTRQRMWSPAEEVNNGPLAAPLKKLVTAWAANRRDGGAVEIGLHFALEYGVPELAGLARVVLDRPADEVWPEFRALALLVLSKYGTAADRPLVARLASDTDSAYFPRDLAERHKKTFADRPWKDYQIRDFAVPALLRLYGQDPTEFGFPWPELKPGRPTEDVLYKYVFPSEAARAAAHAKAKAWLTAHPGR
jgi:RNA polymerase sigma factor (sigma-70 family)